MLTRTEYFGWPGRKFWSLRLGRLLWIEEFDWSVAVPMGGRFGWRVLFSLRCYCRRWTLGCGEHFLCGLCPQCKALVEKDRPGGVR